MRSPSSTETGDPHRTLIRFHQSIFDSTSTGKGVFRPEEPSQQESGDCILRKKRENKTEEEDNFNTNVCLIYRLVTIARFSVSNENVQIQKFPEKISISVYK